MNTIIDAIIIAVGGTNMFLAGIAAERRHWKLSILFLTFGAFLFWVGTL